jgi:hypothetical protein
VRDWRRLGFSRVPPNAALVVDNAPTSRDVAVFELSQPRLAGASLTFRARSLARRPTGVLQRLARRADRLGEAAFGRASLFIDSAPKQLTLVFNVTGDDTVVTQNFQMQFFTATVAGPLVLRSDAAVDSIFGSDGFRVSGPLNDPYSSTFEVPISLSAKDTSVNVQVDIDAGLSATVQVKGNPPPAYPLTAGRYLVPLN